MRVWLVESKRGEPGEGIEGLLRQLEARPDSGLRLLGASPFQPDLAAAMRKLIPDLLDLLVVNDNAWPEGNEGQEVLELGVGVILVAAPDRALRFRTLAQQHPIWFVPPCPSLETLWLALVGSLAGQRRLALWQGQVERLQQRLADRILIEKAKGILVQRLGITEEEAYKRLRMLSRRQRRQIRDIAQSLLDTQFLFLPDLGINGCPNTLAEGPNSPAGHARDPDQAAATAAELLGGEGRSSLTGA